MKDDRNISEAPPSPARQAWLMLVVIKSGKMKLKLAGGQTVKLTTPQVTIKGVGRQKTTRSGRRGRSRSRTTTVPASGKEYYGYSVTLFAGLTRVAAFYSKPSLNPTRKR